MTSGYVRMFVSLRPADHLSYEHMFPRSTPSPLTRRARTALSLARSFLLLEDDYDVDWEVDQDESGREDARERADAPGGDDTFRRGILTGSTHIERRRAGAPGESGRDSRPRLPRSACALVVEPPRPSARRQERAARRRPVCKKNRRRPTLPGPCEPSTIGAEGLNCSVRNGKRCFPLAKATGKRRETEDPPRSFKTAQRHSGYQHAPDGADQKIRQALDQLVPVSFGRYRPSRSGLSTWWSTRGLTPSRGWESSSRGRLPA